MTSGSPSVHTSPERLKRFISAVLSGRFSAMARSTAIRLGHGPMQRTPTTVWSRIIKVRRTSPSW